MPLYIRVRPRSQGSVRCSRHRKVDSTVLVTSIPPLQILARLPRACSSTSSRVDYKTRTTAIATCGFSHLHTSLTMKTALLVIDMQEYFREMGMPVLKSKLVGFAPSVKLNLYFRHVSTCTTIIDYMESIIWIPTPPVEPKHPLHPFPY